MKIITASLLAATFTLTFAPSALRADDNDHGHAVVVGPGHGPSVSIGPGGIGIREGHHGDEHRTTVIEEHRVRSDHHGEHHDD